MIAPLLPVDQDALNEITRAASGTMDGARSVVAAQAEADATGAAYA